MALGDNANSKLIGNLVEALKQNTFANLIAVNTMYRYDQLNEVNKVPPNWGPYTVLLPASTQCLNIFPRNAKRSGFVVANTGANPVYYNNDPFDVNSVIAQLAGSAGVINIGVLAAGQSTSVVTSGPFYAATGPAASQLSITETLYLEVNPDMATGNAASAVHPRDIKKWIDGFITTVEKAEV